MLVSPCEQLAIVGWIPNARSRAPYENVGNSGTQRNVQDGSGLYDRCVCL